MRMCVYLVATLIVSALSPRVLHNSASLFSVFDVNMLLTIVINYPVILMVYTDDLKGA